MLCYIYSLVLELYIEDTCIEIVSQSLLYRTEQLRLRMMYICSIQCHVYPCYHSL